jgi:hypothetical protein
MKAFYTLILVLMAGTALGQSNLPACQGSDATRWNNCFGSWTVSTGEMYVGEFKDGRYNGQGTYTWADETYLEHLWYIGGGLEAADSGLNNYPTIDAPYTAYDKSGQLENVLFGKNIAEYIDVEVFHANFGISFSLGSSGWHASSKSNSYGTASKYFPTNGVFRSLSKVVLLRLTSKESSHSDLGAYKVYESKSTDIL